VRENSRIYQKVWGIKRL